MIRSLFLLRPRQRIFPREATTSSTTTSTATTLTLATTQNAGVETTTVLEQEETTTSTTTVSTEMNLELSATTGLVGITMGEVSTSTATTSTTSESSVPDAPSTTTTEPVFTTTTKQSTTTTTLEDNVTTTTTTTNGPTGITATTEKETTANSETTEGTETTEGNETTEAEDNTAAAITENNDVTEPVTEPTNAANGGNVDEEPEHPTITWPTKNQNLQVKKIAREFVKILSELRGQLDDDFIDRWTGQNGGIGKFQNNADRIMKSITSSDRDCIDLETKIPNPFKQESGLRNTLYLKFDP